MLSFCCFFGHFANVGRCGKATFWDAGLSFCCVWHVSNLGRFGKAMFWDVGFELLLFLALCECWKIWKGNVLGCRF